ncbi:MAG: phosphoribosylamine--glycine ligase, partial [Rhodobacteraceae bacterium]|nr:phosphoribosylamine--glycine ligase [Paracoccaceae bacterium]
INWADDHALSVVYAADGYPGAYETGTVIEGLDGLNDGSALHVFHAGTAAIDGKTLATGGRVLAVTARGDSLKQAHDHAYKTIKKINWSEGFYRTDIGYRAL